MLNFFVSLLVLLICFLVFFRTFWIWHLNQARRKGLYPLNDRATLFDVKRLISSGEKILAIRLYREIYKGISLKGAQRAVEEIERSINLKKKSSGAPGNFSD